MVEDLFKGAKEHGAVPLDRSGKGPVDSRKHHVWNFHDYCLRHSKSVLVESVDSFYFRCFSWSRPSLVEVTGLAQLLKSRHMLLQRSKPPTVNRMWVRIRLCLFLCRLLLLDRCSGIFNWSHSGTHIFPWSLSCDFLVFHPLLFS